MKAYLSIFERAEPGSFDLLHCCYLAPHVLKRRRFDSGFLDPESSLGLRFAQVLERAATVAPSEKLRGNAECALEFLKHKADATTLQKLRVSDG